MKVIGLTGSIATGKSTVSKMFRTLRIPVFDADAHVHLLFDSDTSTIAAIKEAFPNVIQKNQIDRKALGKLVFADDERLEQLEVILHPKVRAAEIAFIFANQKQHHRLCVLGIPLLFETGADVLCDEVWVTYCSDALQRQRIMARKGMTPEKCDKILVRQMPQAEKIAQADRVLPTGIGKAFTMQRLKHYISDIKHA